MTASGGSWTAGIGSRRRVTDLSAHAVLVTGATGDLGEAITSMLLSAGAAVLAVDLDGDGLNAIAERGGN